VPGQTADDAPEAKNPTTNNNKAARIVRTPRPEDIGPKPPPGPPKSNYDDQEDLDQLADMATAMDYDLELVDDEEIDEKGRPVAARVVSVNRRAG